MKSIQVMNFCHWNLNDIDAHDFGKVPLIEAFIKANNIDIICLSETFLHSTIPLNNERLYIKGYSIQWKEQTIQITQKEHSPFAYIIKSIYRLLEKVIFVN